MAPPQWAYQIENYVTEPDEELVCSICRGVFCDPALCPCDHVFCKGCITKWLQSNRNCPICRKRVYNSSIKQTVPIVKNLIMKLMLNCHNKSLGCKTQFSVEGSEAHVKQCEYEFVQCKNTPCTDKLFRKDIAEHETQDCPHRYIKCPNCKCKLPSSSVMDKHSCIKALQNLLKEKMEMIQKQKDQIKALEGEIQTLKATLQDTGRSRTSNFARGQSVTSSTLSSISPDEITINIHDYDSQSSISSDSDMSSDDFYIFTNETLADGNEESDSFSAYMDNEDNVDNEIVQDASEYRNAESQTVDCLSLNYQDEFHNITTRNNNTAYENDSVTVEVPNSVFGETEEGPQARKPTKRRPTTEMPAKRRLRPVRRLDTYSSDDDDGRTHLSSSKSAWHSATANKIEVTNGDQGETSNSYMEAGPSSGSAPIRNTKATASDNPKPKKHSRSKAKPKQAKGAGDCVRDNAVSSRVAASSGNRVFERTLALLEQYNLDSDTEWRPEYASHTGDTATESDSSYLLESSNSELSDLDSLENTINLDSSQRERPAISDFMNWMFDSTSEDDPDWRPQDSSSYKEDEIQ